MILIGQVSATGRTVGHVMVTRPETMSSTATLAQVREAFCDDHVHLVLIVAEGDILQSTINRSDVETAAAMCVPNDAPAAGIGTLRGRTIHVDHDANLALRTLAGAAERRRAVVDHEGRLVGLLCVKRSGRGFCSDATVAERRMNSGN